MNLNKVYIIGRITRDPELKATPSGVSIVNISVATNRTWNDQEKQKHEEVEFHRVVAFGRLADIINQYCVKGSSLLVEGRLKTSQWEKDGVKKQQTSIIAESIQLGPKAQAKTEPIETVNVESGYIKEKPAIDLPVLEEEGEETKVDDQIPF